MPDADPTEAADLAALAARLRVEWLRTAPPAEVAAFQARVIREAEAAARTRPASSSPASAVPPPAPRVSPLESGRGKQARDMTPAERAAFLAAHRIYA